MPDRQAGSTRRRGPLYPVQSLPSQFNGAQSPVHIGLILRGHREAVGLTQEQAAVRSGLTRNTIVSLERKVHPDPHLSTMLALMCTYRLASLEELLGTTPSLTLANAWAGGGWVGGRPSAAN